MTNSQLTQQERQVLDLKYKSKRIGDMTTEEVSLWSKALLIKIHVITGWTIPATDEFLNILLDQFEKKLMESYGNLNTEEIEYAFRTQGSQVEDWGKAMNLNLVGKVLDPYLEERYKVSELERNLHTFKHAHPLNRKIVTNYRRQIEEDYQSFIGGHIKFSVFPNEYYDTLVEDGMIPEKAYARRANLYAKRYPDVPEKKLITTARDRCVLQLFRIARKRGYKNLYTKN